MFQAYEAIDDAGEEGLSAAEFAKKLGLNKLDTRSQLKYLEKFDLVDPYMTDSKRQRLTRYVAKRYSCNKITKTWIQISHQNWNGFFSNASHQIMI